MNEELSPGCSTALGLSISLPFVLIGVYIIAASLDVIRLDPSFFKAPRAIVAAAGMCFFLGGVWIAMKSTSGIYGQDTPMVKWMSYFLALAIMAAFTWLFLWTGFGPGMRQFETSTSIGPAMTSGSGDETAGRSLFGFFGVASLLGTLVYAFTWPLKILGKIPGKNISGQDG